MDYQIVLQNPYNQKELPDNSKGLLIKSKWKSEYKNIIEKNNVNTLFLNYSLGWQCDNYSFFNTTPFLQYVDIIDTHDRGIKNVEKLNDLRELNLNIPLKTEVDFTLFKKLVSCYVNWNKKLLSIFDTLNLQQLYIDGLKVKDEHKLGNLINLKELKVGNSNFTNLDFLTSLKGLKTLELLNCKKIVSFSPIASLKELTRLNIDGYKDIESIDFVGQLTKLEILLLNVGRINSIKCLKFLNNLRAISFNGSSTIIIDGDLTVLTELNKLAMLMIVNRKHYTHKLIKPWNWKNFNIPDKLLELK